MVGAPDGLRVAKLLRSGVMERNVGPGCVSEVVALFEGMTCSEVDHEKTAVPDVLSLVDALDEAGAEPPHELFRMFC